MADHSDDNIINIATGNRIDSNGNVLKKLLSISKSLVQEHIKQVRVL